MIFGDILLFSGLALGTHSIRAFIIPLIMTLIFIFNIIPLLDQYLAKKYGDEFYEFSRKTKKLIPYVY